MSNIDNLLSRLEKVKRTGSGTYQARCPAHADRGPSLSIRELDDGRILLHCFAGCMAHEVLEAVGLSIHALFPERDIQHGRPERRPFPAADVLRAISLEAIVVAVVAVDILGGHAINAIDRKRLILAVQRIQAALTAAGVDHG